MRRYDKIVLVDITKEVYDDLVKYCKKNNLVMWKFVTEAISKAINGDKNDRT